MSLYLTKKDKAVNAVIYGALFVVTMLSLLPIVNTLAISLSNSAKASAGLVAFLPVGFNLESYVNILKESAFFTAFLISVKRVVLSTAMVFFVTIITAYPLSKEKEEFRARNVYVWIFVFTMLFGVGIIPSYLNIRALGLTGKIWALVLPGVVNQFLVILTINFFRSLPKELEECASIDGAGPWRTLFQIFVPLSKPILATIVLFNIVWHWNDFFGGLVYMNRTEQYPLQTYIQQLVVNINPSFNLDTSRIAQTLQVSKRTLNAAKIVVTMVPVLVIYPFVQNYFIKGIMLGSIKE